MLQDLNRNTTLSYNPTDLISSVDFNNGGKLEYFYAGAAKLRTLTYQNNQVTNTIDYTGRFTYENGILSSIQTSEGRIVRAESAKYGDIFFREYQIKDHLGNGESEHTS
jgi:hypothetical protein